MRIGIVGAGPSGLYAGIMLSRDFEVKIFEEHNVVGEPQHCTGLVSRYVVEKSGGNSVLNRVRGARIFHGNRSITIEKKEIAAYVIDRYSFDNGLYSKVIDSVLLGERVKGIEMGKELLIKTTKNDYKFHVIIGADGVRSTLRNIVDRRNINYLNGVQVLMKKNEIDKEYVQIFLDRKYSDGFFSWAVPRDDDMLVGLATYDYRPMERLKTLIREKFSHKEIKGVNAGQIPVGILGSHTNGKIYLTGDAAVFVKATSGGGLYYGLLGSEILSRSIREGNSYEKALSTIMQELKMDYLIHKIFSKLNDREIERMMKSLEDEYIIRDINKYGDIDHPSIIAKRLLLRGKMIETFPHIFKAFLKSMFF